MEVLNSNEYQLFLWLNGFHTPFFDTVMAVITHRLTWIPFYALLLVYLFRIIPERKVVSIFFIVAAVGLADFVASGLMKPYFHRFRPCHDPNIQDLVHVVGNCGGNFGFVSSHASTTFALFAGLFFILGWRNNITKVVLVWSLIVSYSRIYVGVHFPSDVFVGMLVGGLSALFLDQLLNKLFKPNA